MGRHADVPCRLRIARRRGAPKPTGVFIRVGRSSPTTRSPLSRRSYAPAAARMASSLMDGGGPHECQPPDRDGAGPACAADRAAVVGGCRAAGRVVRGGDSDHHRHPRRAWPDVAATGQHPTIVVGWPGAHLHHALARYERRSRATRPSRSTGISRVSRTAGAGRHATADDCRRCPIVGTDHDDGAADHHGRGDLHDQVSGATVDCASEHDPAADLPPAR